MMIKLISPMTRLDNMSKAEFDAYYVEQHTKVGGGFPGHVRYVGAPAIQSVHGEAPFCDSVAELWWESFEAMRTAWVSEQWEVARRDHTNVVSGRLMFMAEEHEILKPPTPGSGAIKYYAFLHRHDNQSRADFERYWLDKHVPLALETPNLKGYRASVGFASAMGDGPTLDPPEGPQFDGAVEMWFDGVEAFEESFADPFWDRLREDYYANFAMGRWQVLVREHLVFDLTGQA
jgi:uncharacterized protein (TIGR02118 family)